MNSNNKKVTTFDLLCCDCRDLIVADISEELYGHIAEGTLCEGCHEEYMEEIAEERELYRNKSNR